jgi:hypothetical protein
MATSLEGLADIREAQQRQAEQQAGMVPLQMPVESSIGVGGPPPSYGGAALGGMSEANLKQGFAEEAASIGAGGTPMVSTPLPPQTLNDQLTKLAPKAVDSLQRRAGVGTQSQGLPIEAVPHMMDVLNYPLEAAQGGGLMQLAIQDGGFSGQVPGQGHGMEDNVYMPIVERQAGNQVGTLAVSPDEYVVDAHTMSALGNGSADAGANVMDQVIENVREEAFGTTQQPNEINGLAALRPMMGRI